MNKITPRLQRLLVLLVLAVVPAMAFAYDAKVGELFYNFNKSAKTAEVTYEDWNKFYQQPSIVIPSTVEYQGVTYTVTSIGPKAFISCRSLTSVTLPSTVTTLGESAFERCYDLTAVTLPGAITSIPAKAFDNDFSLLAINLPPTVTEIGPEAFAYCWGLTTFTIPDAVTTIGDWAFLNCKFTEVHIGTGLTTLVRRPFDSCEDLAKIYLANPEPPTAAEEAFASCDSLTSINLPAAIKELPYWTFMNCWALTSINLDEVTRIGESAFENCKKLTYPSLPKVRYIGRSAFEGCTSMYTVDLGAELDTIRSDAFAGCTKLSRIDIDAVTPPVAAESSLPQVFCDSGELRVPTACKAAYVATAPWARSRTSRRTCSEPALSSSGPTLWTGRPRWLVAMAMWRPRLLFPTQSIMQAADSW